MQNEVTPKVIPLPKGNVRRYADQLRKMADWLDANPEEQPEAMALVMVNPDGELDLYHWGDGGNALLSFMLARAHHKIIADPDGRRS